MCSSNSFSSAKKKANYKDESTWLKWFCRSRRLLSVYNVTMRLFVNLFNFIGLIQSLFLVVNYSVHLICRFRYTVYTLFNIVKILLNSEIKHFQKTDLMIKFIKAHTIWRDHYGFLKKFEKKGFSKINKITYQIVTCVKIYQRNSSKIYLEKDSSYWVSPHRCQDNCFFVFFLKKLIQTVAHTLNNTASKTYFSRICTFQTIIYRIA